MSASNRNMPVNHKNLDERKLKEVEHSDLRRSIVEGYEYYTDTSRKTDKGMIVTEGKAYKRHFSNMKFYSIARSSFSYRDNLLNQAIVGRRVLDYCCGNGEIAVAMAKRGAREAVGIDISEVAIKNGAQLAAMNGVAECCEFKVMDAEAMEFAESSFDVIHEYGALHHLDLDAAYRELSRILNHDGRVVCTEALRHNPFIHYYRKRTPHLRTKWEFEHILGVPEIMRAVSYFEQVNIRFFHLAVLGAVPFRKTSFFHPVLSILERADNVIMNIPYLQQMAWVAVFVLKGPRKTAI